ncbi:MAG TPA: hypothetical protein EYQ21_03815 [Flavobacteriales bacterium]|nr:hypothetical protein [Flavobacteriales bacterium]
MRALLLTIALSLTYFLSLGQTPDNNSLEVLDLSIPQEYRIGGITVVGAKYTDVQAIKLFSSLQIGASITIPGEKLGEAIKNLWNQDLFADISIEAAELRDRDVYLVIRVKELPRLTRYSIAGVNRSEQETIRGKIDFTTGRIVNENVLATATKRINDHYRDKGYLDIDVDIVQEVDSSFANGTIVRVNINKGNKVKIDLITLSGVTAFEPNKLKRKMKSTKEKKWWRFYKASKYIADGFDTDQQVILALYNNEGYRNARILNDSVYRTEEGLIGLILDIEEGNQFRFGNISFTGNTKYRSTQLDSLLGIRKGDVYSLAHLETRVFMDPKGMDLSSLYQDDGYLTFRAMPIEQKVDNDTIDIEIRMMEGQQFRIGKVLVEGNTKTNDPIEMR